MGWPHGAIENVRRVSKWYPGCLLVSGRSSGRGGPGGPDHRGGRGHVCVCVCMHVYMYVCTYVSMYACTHVCMHACMHVCDASTTVC